MSEISSLMYKHEMKLSKSDYIIKYIIIFFHLTISFIWLFQNIFSHTRWRILKNKKRYLLNVRIELAATKTQDLFSIIRWRRNWSDNSFFFIHYIYSRILSLYKIYSLACDWWTFLSVLQLSCLEYCWQKISLADWPLLSTVCQGQIKMKTRYWSLILRFW